MEIAPGVTAAAYAAVDPALDDPASPRWADAIDVLRKRIGARYLNPAQILMDDDDKRPALERRHGFAIIALDCLLIETFQSFIEGETDPERMSARMFRTFLGTRPAFSPYFTTPDLAQQFYEDFRCGILHQAEIKGESRVWSVGNLMRMDGAGMVINRTAFHQGVVAEFQTYLAALADPTNADLRRLFRNKMRFIARMAP